MRSGSGWVTDTGIGPGVVLIIGAPGVGKSTLARTLLEKHCHSSMMLNTGQQLRAMGMVHEQLLHPSVEGMEELQRTARKLLAAACCSLKQRWDGQCAESLQALYYMLLCEHVCVGVFTVL